MTVQETAIRRTDDEVLALKDNWKQDPCWDIENTDGFEAHHDELLQWRQDYEAKCAQRWEEAQEARRAKQREVWGSAPDAALDYIHRIETRLLALEEKVSMIKPSALYAE